MPTAGPTIPALPDAAWMRRAACRDEDADALTPHEGEEEESKRLKANRDRICLGLEPCPVLNECLAFALDTQDLQTGIAGGLTATQREPLHSRRRRSA